MTRVLIAAAVAAALALPATLPADELTSLRTLAVQDGGRIKPLDTLGRETARRVGGAKPFGFGDTVQGMEPAQWILSLLTDGERWRTTPMIRVTHAGLREVTGLPVDRDHFSFEELAGHAGFRQAIEKLRARFDTDPNAKMDPVEEEVSALYDTLVLLDGMFTGRSLHMVPPGNDPRAAWLTVTDIGTLQTPDGAALRARVAAVARAQSSGDRAALGSAASDLAAVLRQKAPDVYPAMGGLDREVALNRLKPFRWAWLFYLGAFLLALASFPLGAPRIAWAGAALATVGLGLNTWGLIARTLVSGRAPVTNMYESVVFVAWGAMLLALVFEAIYRTRYVLATAAPLAVTGLILADSVPILDGTIQPLVPVLRDNFWLTTHVLTITLGYAAFFLAMGMGHLNLGLYFFAPRRQALLHTLSLFLYRALQVGTLFLAVGTLLGGVWASYSWGRFWGWDPKETWALIALLGYLTILHGRLLGWFREFGLAVGSILGFLLVLMAWYGVNFVLGTGLHSYGFGSGGYTWIGGYLAFEGLVLAAATSRYLKEHRASATPAPAPEHLPTPGHA